MEMPDDKFIKTVDITQRSIDINKPHFDSLDVANAISKREQSVLTAAALKYSRMKGIKDPQDEIEALKAENEELKAKLERAKWQPIETAPKDGTEIIVLVGVQGYVTKTRWEYHPYHNGFGWSSLTVSPTHWMPLPDAPEQR